VECVYAESRVGRVRGIRTKKYKSRTNQNDTTIEAEDEISSDPTDMSTSTSTSGPSGSTDAIAADNDFYFPQPTVQRRMHTQSTSAGGFEDVVLNWSNELAAASDVNMLNDTDQLFANLVTENQHGQISPVNDSQFGTETRRTSFSQAESDIRSPEVNFETTTHSDRRSHFALARRKPLHAQLQLSSNSRYTSNRTSSQCIVACTKIILSLEKYLIDDLKVLDLIFDIVKKVMGQLNPLVEYQFVTRDMKCLTIFRVIVKQIIELLEAGCANFFAELQDDGASEEDGDVIGGSLSNLGFGFLNVTPGDQRRWRSQLVLEELQPISQNLRKIVALINTNLQFTASQVDIQTSLSALMETTRRRGGLT
jgi:hypothetical protein